MLLLPRSTTLLFFSYFCMYSCDLDGITCSNDTRFWCVCCMPMQTLYLHPLPLLGFKSNCRYCGAFQVVLVETDCQCRRRKRHGFDPWVRRIPWRRTWKPTPVFLPEESHRGAWWAKVHRIVTSQTWLKQPSAHAYIGIVVTRDVRGRFWGKMLTRKLLKWNQ